MNLRGKTRGKYIFLSKRTPQGILGKQAVVNMAAAVGRLLSFSKNAKGLVSPLRLSVVPVHRYSLEISATGEPVTHTGQVSLKVIVFEYW